MKSSHCKEFECLSSINGECNACGGECMKNSNKECFNFGSCSSCRNEDECFSKEE